MEPAAIVTVMAIVRREMMPTRSVTPDLSFALLAKLIRVSVVEETARMTAPCIVTFFECHHDGHVRTFSDLDS